MAFHQGPMKHWPKMVLLIIIFVFIPGLFTKSSVTLDKPESISVAADAIGMYLKKIANKELFVLKMQEISSMRRIIKMLNNKKHMNTN